jgi:hypothetical protein
MSRTEIVGRPDASMTLETARYRTAQARAQALRDLGAAENMIACLKLLRRHVPEPATDALREIQLKLAAMQAELQR